MPAAPASGCDGQKLYSLWICHVARAWPTESLKELETGRRGTLRRTLGRGGGVLVFVLSLFGLCSPTSLFKFLNIFLIRWLFLFPRQWLKVVSESSKNARESVGS